MRCPTCKRTYPPQANTCPEDGAALLAPLSQSMVRGPISLSQATKIIDATCELLEPVHSSGRVYGCISPDTVFYRHVGDELTVMLIDRVEISSRDPRYVSPERLRGQPEDARADVHALGVLFHH